MIQVDYSHIFQKDWIRSWLMGCLGPSGLDIWDSLKKAIVMKGAPRFESQTTRPQTTNLPFVEKRCLVKMKDIYHKYLCIHRIWNTLVSCPKSSKSTITWNHQRLRGLPVKAIAPGRRPCWWPRGDGKTHHPNKENITIVFQPSIYGISWNFLRDLWNFLRGFLGIFRCELLGFRECKWVFP